MDDPQLKIRIRASRRLCFFLLLVHAMALGSVPLIAAGTATRLLLVTLILASLAAELLRHILSLRHRGLQIGYADGQWSLSEFGKQAPCRLRADSSIFGGLIVLRFQMHDRRRPRSFVLMADSCGADELRRLRVLLRTRGSDSL